MSRFGQTVKMRGGGGGEGWWAWGDNYIQNVGGWPLEARTYILAAWCDVEPIVTGYGFTVAHIYGAGTSAWVIVLDWDGATPAESLAYTVESYGGILVHDISNITTFNKTGT